MSNKNLSTEITAALNAFKPSIAAAYAQIVSRQYAAMVADLGPTLPGVSNSWTWAKLWTRTLAGFVETEQATGHRVMVLDRVEKAAAAYADDVVAAWHLKINEKLGELDAAEVKAFGADTFHITGTRNGMKVMIEQSRIINVSKTGALFHQFPARIYVDGTFKSAAAYKKLAA